VPLAAFATVEGADMHLRAMVATPDGKRIASAEVAACARPKRWARKWPSCCAQDAEDILSSCLSEAAQAEADARSATLAAGASRPPGAIGKPGACGDHPPAAQAAPLAARIAALGRPWWNCRCWKSPLPDQRPCWPHWRPGAHQYALVAFVSPNAIDAALRTSLAGRRDRRRGGRGQPRCAGHGVRPNIVSRADAAQRLRTPAAGAGPASPAASPC
jgi:hypothetical protein